MHVTDGCGVGRLKKGVREWQWGSLLLALGPKGELRIESKGGCQCTVQAEDSCLQVARRLCIQPLNHGNPCAAISPHVLSLIKLLKHTFPYF